jgi:hypothetical protein
MLMYLYTYLHIQARTAASKTNTEPKTAPFNPFAPRPKVQDKVPSSHVNSFLGEFIIMLYLLSFCVLRRIRRQNRLYETLDYTVIILSKHHHNHHQELPTPLPPTQTPLHQVYFFYFFFIGWSA